MNSTNIDERWLSLVAGLSGLYCASLNQISNTTTSKPKYLFPHIKEGNKNIFIYFF
jgi:hypothetical protein